MQHTDCKHACKCKEAPSTHRLDLEDELPCCNPLPCLLSLAGKACEPMARKHAGHARCDAFAPSVVFLQMVFIPACLFIMVMHRGLRSVSLQILVVPFNGSLPPNEFLSLPFIFRRELVPTASLPTTNDGFQRLLHCIGLHKEGENREPLQSASVVVLTFTTAVPSAAGP